MNLKAGGLSLIYENGFLRYITAGKDEIIRGIYFAVRDKDWDTLPSQISHEEISQKENSFLITYQRHFNWGDIQMFWQVWIEGLESSEILFKIKGRALGRFLKNRVGFCVLHPIEETAGAPVVIGHTGGKTRQYAFPTSISPFQPFKNIRSMEWKVNEWMGHLKFEGDVFETEDQRNWTDDSFKTYCTPLDLPFPSWMDEGQEVDQRIHFRLSAAPIPAIGIGRSTIRNKHYLAGLQLLSEIGFSHYRTAIHLSDKNWRQVLNESLEESGVLKAPLEIALFMTAGEDIRYFLDITTDPRAIRQIILLEQDKASISNSLPDAVVPLLRERFPGTLIGAGTDGHFTELNRSDLEPEGLDFVTYAVHPQVHAFDDLTVMENAAAQRYTVQTAKQKYGIPVHLSPVTLHARSIADARLHTHFGAAWTLESLRSLTAAGASSVTYFQAIGEMGVAGYETEFNPYPLLEVFRDWNFGR